MYPARWFYFGREAEPTTEVALRRGAAGDLYLVLVSYTVETQEAQLLVRFNPLVNWIWLGVALLAVGTIIAILPERSFAFATSRVPDAAVTTTTVLLLIVFGVGAGVAHAQ